jgi:hypothetical protein
MWTFLLDPVFQGLAFAVALSALGYVAWELYDGTHEAAPSRRYARGRREPPRPAGERRRVYVEPSVELWTDSQGQTRGRVRRGPCRGMQIEEMSREECEAQAAYAREHDPAAAASLESYIRQRFGPRRRYEAQLADGALTRAQAFAELGLGEDASEAEIHAAYRTLIKTHHPDHGGSNAKAARINQAKDLLAG